MNSNATSALHSYPGCERGFHCRCCRDALVQGGVVAGTVGARAVKVVVEAGAVYIAAPSWYTFGVTVITTARTELFGRSRSATMALPETEVGHESGMTPPPTPPPKRRPMSQVTST